MDEADPRDEIEQLEARIDELAAAIESCHRVIVLSRVAIGLGAVLLVAIAAGIVGFDAMAMLGAIAAMLGGIVLLGSNASTSKEAAAALQAAETRRAALIGEIDLRLVGDTDTNGIEQCRSS